MIPLFSYFKSIGVCVTLRNKRMKDQEQTKKIKNNMKTYELFSEVPESF